MAKSLRDVLVARNVSVSHSECLEIVAQQFGFANWNTLSSKLDNEASRPAPSKDSLPHAPPWADECKEFPDDRMPAVAITGDLKIMPVYVVDWRPGIFSEPIELSGNGTYRIALTPMQPREPLRQGITCRSCGSPGSILRVVLADAEGRRLGSVILVTLPHTVGVAIFGRHGVMLQSVPRSWTSGPPLPLELPNTFSSRTFSAAVINRR
jgi:hypothetical protein